MAAIFSTVLNIILWCLDSMDTPIKSTFQFPFALASCVGKQNLATLFHQQDNNQMHYYAS